MMRAWIAAALLLVAGLPARAAEPAAIVEDAAGAVTGAEPMDYVSVGAVIRLGAGARVTIGYLKSCIHEVITGGVVTIGTEISQVVEGQVQRDRVECDGGKLRLTAEQAAQSGVVAFRKGPARKAPEPALILYGRSPAVTAAGAGALAIERLDRAAPALTAWLVLRPGRRDAAVDLAKTGQSLEPGGLYRLSISGRDLVVKIDPAAKPGTTPLIGRLVRL